jgi:pilus assembly protein CpaB
MKSKLPFIVALLFGAAALFSIRSYLSKKEAQIAASERGIKVLAARVTIAAGAEITTEMLREREVPEKYLPAQIIRRSADLKLVVGRRTLVRVEPNQLLLWSDLAGETSRSGFSALVPAGERGYTVTIGKGLRAGLIQNGDHIDIMATFALPKGGESAGGPAWRPGGSDMVNVVLLQNVTVLAVGDSYGDISHGDGGGGTDLTLSLTLQEAQSLMFAAQHGELGAVLRRDGSTETKTRADLPRVTFEDVEKIIGDLDTSRATRIVEVQKGPRTESIPVSTSPMGADAVKGGLR